MTTINPLPPEPSTKYEIKLLPAVFRNASEALRIFCIEAQTHYKDYPQDCVTYVGTLSLHDGNSTTFALNISRHDYDYTRLSPEEAQAFDPA